ncbi:tRNA modification GTPase MnmE [Clostridia bacterium]|nr:tRNA modification GTPase MnmE [Clostridia bacterium]
MYNNDTIAAVATAQGVGGVAIVRISGTNAPDILCGIFKQAGKPSAFKDRVMYYGHVTDGGEIIDEALAVMMYAPRSFTRENVAEIHIHGGVITTERTLTAALKHGARLAEPGEFLRRAFENGRVDLAQAESSLQLIEAQSETAARSALAALSGGLSSYITRVKSSLIAIRAAIEAAIDFPDEIDETTTASEVSDKLNQIRLDLLSNCDPNAGRIIEDGLNVVIAGLPNAGKSALMNALLRRERSIVHETAGTTRDILTETLRIDGVTLRLSDTAGLRSPMEPAEPIETIGVELAKKCAKRADLVLYVIDSAKPADGRDIDNLASLTNYLVILNKIDQPQCVRPGAFSNADVRDVLQVSAATGEGVAELSQELSHRARTICVEPKLITNARHIEAARNAQSFIEDALETLNNKGLFGEALTLALIDISAAHNALSQITGESATENVINEIFSRFCVGK